MTSLQNITGVIDSHAHIDFPVFLDDQQAMLTRMREAGVAEVICVGTTLKHSDRPRILAESADNIWFTVGVHPNHVDEDDRYNDRDAFMTAAEHPRCVAIGEAGLDYMRQKSAPERQKISFQTQLEVAAESDLPIVIHAREADEDMADMIGQAAKNSSIKGVLHCFSSGKQLAEKALEIGFYISFSGILTFNNADWLREIAATIPLDRLLVETDAPYLSPEPVRKIKRNEPAHVIHTLAKLAEIKGETVENMAAITSSNTRQLFHRMNGSSGS